MLFFRICFVTLCLRARALRIESASTTSNLNYSHTFHSQALELLRTPTSFLHGSEANHRYICKVHFGCVSVPAQFATSCKTYCAECFALEAPQWCKTRADRGDRGERGRSGRRGPDGLAGVAGADGKPGADGADGKPGADGADGKSGPMGPPGPNGLAYVATLSKRQTWDLSNQYRWVPKSFTDTELLGHTGSFIFGYLLGTSGTYYFADLCLDQISGAGLDFNTDMTKYKTSSGYSTLNALGADPIQNGNMQFIDYTATYGQFHIQRGGPWGSSATGADGAQSGAGNYLAAETSYTNGRGKYMYLQSPPVTVTGDCTLSLFLHAYGTVFLENSKLEVWFLKSS